MNIDMRAPRFWWQSEPNILAYLLSPFGSAYGAITAWRMARPGWQAGVAVFCIGNFVAGGAGKTPTAIAIARILQAQGETPVFLSRGYRSQSGRGPTLVDPSRHSAQDVGDEALLLASVAPTIVGSDRVASAKAGESLGATLLILDDGLQNPSLAKDFRLVVMEATTKIGNGFCVPAGPLRAPLHRQLPHASALVMIGEGETATGLSKAAQDHLLPIFGARLVVEKQAAANLAGRRVFAFAGIGLPDKFKATLKESGAELAGWRSFPDHHLFSVKELRQMQAEAARMQALLVTTEKDFVRITQLLDGLDRSLPQPVAVPVALVFQDERALRGLLTQALEAVRKRRA